MPEFDWIVIAFFKIVNFILLLAVARYVFKKHLLPTIKQDISDQEERIETSKDHKRSLVRREKEMRATIHQEATEYERLKEQVMQWRSLVRQELQKRKEEKEIRIQEITSDMRAQAERVMVNKTYEQLIPLVVADVRSTLCNEWTDKKAQELNRAIVGTMQKSNS